MKNQAGEYLTHSQDRTTRVRGLTLINDQHAYYWRLVHVKSIMDEMPSKFPVKICTFFDASAE